ncbi:MAG: glycosyltransferase family 9 protein, partial [Gemmatimonadota bacterium]|nr:glycosyltransferase family 9 protein [Gemmatimonadota bacterium]
SAQRGRSCRAALGAERHPNAYERKEPLVHLRVAQTWPPAWWKHAFLGAVDLLGRPLSSVWRLGTARQVHAEPQRILVVELWQIGDVVLATPFLSALRRCFPQAQISLLGKPHADVLLRASGLVDEVIVACLPWTRTQRKYNPADYDWRGLRKLVRALRERRFDLAFDARMDLRSNILVALSGARRRVGFGYGGGDWLLTDAVPVDPKANHKVEDWLALMRAVGCGSLEEQRCVLTTTEAERTAARALLAGHFGIVRQPIALHPGGSHAGKRWPIERFTSLAQDLVAAGHQVVVLEEPSGYGEALRKVKGILPVRVGLREMMAMIEQCATLVCNDSGPMHVAAALGVPTVAIFERGQPKWFGPVGKAHIVIEGELSGVDVSAAPIDRPPPKPVPIERVQQAVLGQIEGQKATRHWSLRPGESGSFSP